ncbi:uncharacterized protein LOC117568626 [Drosophila albomicans]|uniref:Uncharacterized protein LOC117568626 n=1 Tax=Drosophila albomicans TaxID=7291 RepID=A0A6P8X0M5_DROAB|nr:uncharacterized protein LOC117568626 [Drosophila albomicans]
MEEQGLLSYVKKMVHSLIVSTPQDMTVEQLKRDYINVDGVPLPFSKLGFKDVESFLRSIPDTVSVRGCGPMALLVAKKNEKSAHIQSLVQCQKKPSVKARKQIWSRYPTERSDLVFVNEKSNASRPVYNNNRGRRSYATNKNNYNSRQVHQRPSTNSIASSLKKVSIANVEEEDNVKHCMPDNKEDIKPIISDHTDKNDNNLDKKPIATYHTEYISSDEGCDEDALPAYAVDDQIRNLIVNDNDFDVKPEIRTVLIEPKKEPVDKYVSSDDGNDEEAIPGYAVDDRVLKVDYPTDAVRYDFVLPVRDINKRLKLDDRIRVKLVSVSSPHSFFFWIQDEEYDTYKAMAINMQFYYRDIDMKKYTIPLHLVMPGHLGAIHTRGTFWQRVRVLAVKMGHPMNIEACVILVLCIIQM